jgi:hypothetical protein
MKKKGQLTIFILIGVVIAFSIISFYVAKDSVKALRNPSFSEDVRSVISSCLEESGEAAVLVVLAQGGIYEKNNLDNFQVYKLAKPTGKGDGVKAIERNGEYEFTKENIGDSVEVFSSEVFEVCIDGIDFDKFDGEVVFDEFDIDVDVGNKDIVVEADFPVMIKKGNFSMYLDDFVYEEEVDVKDMMNVVNGIVDGSVELNFPPYGLMDDLEEEYGVDIDVEFVFEELAIENMIYSIKFKGEDQVVAFAIHYDWYEYE